MRGFFAIGVESLSKQMNAGNLFRSAHAFGASFVFTIGGIYSPNLAKSNTSKSIVHMPIYNYNKFIFKCGSQTYQHVQFQLGSIT